MTNTMEFVVEKKEMEDLELFDKRTIVELSDSELAEVQGGTTPVCAATAAAAAWSSTYCAGAAVGATLFVASAVVGYFS